MEEEAFESSSVRHTSWNVGEKKKSMDFNKKRGREGVNESMSPKLRKNSKPRKSPRRRRSRSNKRASKKRKDSIRLRFGFRGDGFDQGNPSMGSDGQPTTSGFGDLRDLSVSDEEENVSVKDHPSRSNSLLSSLASSSRFVPDPTSSVPHDTSIASQSPASDRRDFRQDSEVMGARVPGVTRNMDVSYDNSLEISPRFVPAPTSSVPHKTSQPPISRRIRDLMQDSQVMETRVSGVTSAIGKQRRKQRGSRLNPTTNATDAIERMQL